MFFTKKRRLFIIFYLLCVNKAPPFCKTDGKTEHAEIWGFFLPPTPCPYTPEGPPASLMPLWPQAICKDTLLCWKGPTD